MSAVVPERRTAMYHAQLTMGAVMADARGWRLPVHYGDATREAVWLRETVGVSDISPTGKLRVVGEDAGRVVAVLVPGAMEQPPGSVREADSTFAGGGKLLAARLAPDEFVALTPPGAAPLAMAAMLTEGDAPRCAHIVDITSGLAGVSITGPATADLMSRITELDVSPRVLPNLACIQSRFADIQGLLLRQDVQEVPIHQLYAGREFGEYLWEALIEIARQVGGGPVGTEARTSLRTQF